VQPPCGWAYRATLPNDPANNLQALREQGFRWPGTKEKPAAAISRPLQGRPKQGEALKAPARFIGLLASIQRVRVVVFVERLVWVVRLQEDHNGVAQHVVPALEGCDLTAGQQRVAL